MPKISPIQLAIEEKEPFMEKVRFTVVAIFEGKSYPLLDYSYEGRTPEEALSNFSDRVMNSIQSGTVIR